jgi:hypothetical protein
MSVDPITAAVAKALPWLTCLNSATTNPNYNCGTCDNCLVHRPAVEALLREQVQAVEAERDRLRRIIENADMVFDADGPSHVELGEYDEEGKYIPPKELPNISKLQRENAELRQQLSSSEQIRHAEKEILIAEIAAHKATRERLAETRRALDTTAGALSLLGARIFEVCGDRLKNVPPDTDLAEAWQAGKPVLEQARALRKEPTLRTILDEAKQQQDSLPPWLKEGK